MLVSVTSDFMTNEALIVMHVLCSLGGRKLNGIHIHSIRVTVERRQ